MKPADIGIAVLVAVIWGLAFVASRLALDQFSPELMTTLRFAVAAVPCLFVRKPIDRIDKPPEVNPSRPTRLVDPKQLFFSYA